MGVEFKTRKPKLILFFLTFLIDNLIHLIFNLNCSQSRFPTGSGLFQTVSVRPCGMYGELDVYLIASLVKRAAARGGVAVVVGPKNGEVRYFPSPR